MNHLLKHNLVLNRSWVRSVWPRSFSSDVKELQERGRPGATERQTKVDPTQAKADPTPADAAKRLKELITNNPDKHIHWEYHQDLSKSKIYDKKPLKIHATEGRIYLWCACGWSKQQPFCDGSHRTQHYHIKERPVPWKCRQTGDYWLCNCKRTKLRPFCDGTHLNPEVKDAVDVTVKH